MQLTGKKGVTFYKSLLYYPPNTSPQRTIWQDELYMTCYIADLFEVLCFFLELPSISFTLDRNVQLTY